MDQFRGYTVAGMFLVNFVGGLDGLPGGAEAPQRPPVLQLRRHDHAQLHVRGRLLVSADRAATAGQAGRGPDYGHFLVRSLALVLISLVMYARRRPRRQELGRS